MASEASGGPVVKGLHQFAVLKEKKKMLHLKELGNEGKKHTALQGLDYFPIDFVSDDGLSQQMFLSATRV